MNDATGEPDTPPGVVPYVEYHTGRRRALTISLTYAGGILSGAITPVVSIDGRQYLVYWGPMTFEVPADRAVHVSVHIASDRTAHTASTLLPPGPSTALVYRADLMSGHGSLRPAT